MLVADGAHVLEHMTFIKNCIVKLQLAEESSIIRAADCRVVSVKRQISLALKSLSENECTVITIKLNSLILIRVMEKVNEGQ